MYLNLKSFIRKYYFATPLILLCLVVLLKQVIFSLLVPIWHAPDEQAHFAQVANMAEDVSIKKGNLDLNLEIYTTEKLLGTLRDHNGNNKFTFHPEYKIEYTEGLVGFYEKEIISLPESSRKIFAAQEAANYPQLYYFISSWFYKLFYHTDIIFRVYSVRIFSIILHLLTTITCYYIAKLLFPLNKTLQLAIPLIASFQPMFSFVSIGVNSDNLMNFLFTLLIYLCLRLINSGLNIFNVFCLLGCFLALFLTKPQYLLAIPTIYFAIIIRLGINKQIKRIIFVSLVPIIFIIFSKTILKLTDTLYPQNFFTLNLRIDKNFFPFFKLEFIHTIKEVIPWYWGVFDWLGVTLPRTVNRIINRIMVIALIGLLLTAVKLIKNIITSKKVDVDQKHYSMLVFLILTSVLYFLGIVYFNYLFYLSSGFPFGIQGRYFFPVISSHMILIIIGILGFIPQKFVKMNHYLVITVVLMMITVNFIALWTLINTYYTLSNFNLLLIQISQYKPLYFKGNFLILWLVLYLFSLILLIRSFLNIKPNFNYK